MEKDLQEEILETLARQLFSSNLKLWVKSYREENPQRLEGNTINEVFDKLVSFQANFQDLPKGEAIAHSMFSTLMLVNEHPKEMEWIVKTALGE